MTKVIKYIEKKRSHSSLGETLFCWAFAISTMLRQSLCIFLKSLPDSDMKEKALKMTKDYSLHKRLRNELIMLPIPKTRFNDQNLKFEKNVKKATILSQQKHCLELALNRVNLE